MNIAKLWQELIFFCSKCDFSYVSRLNQNYLQIWPIFQLEILTNFENISSFIIVTIFTWLEILVTC